MSDNNTDNEDDSMEYQIDDVDDINNNSDSAPENDETLKKLDFEGSYVSDDMLCEFVCHLPNIESLVICDTYVKSEGLRNIMLYCVSLEHLNLNGCHHINDVVIQGIFQTESALDFGCKYTLKEIDLQLPVTSVGISCLLNYFPNLMRVDHVELYEAVFNIYVDNIRNNALPLKVHNLTELEIDGTYISDESCFRIYSIVCPYLVKLSLFIYADTEQREIDALTGFTCLKEVNIENGAFRNIDFSPFLEHNGEKLEVITIDNSVSLTISLQSLIVSCPNLKILDVTNVSFEPIEENYPLTRKLSKLKAARLTLDFSEPYAIESVSTILSSSPNLKVLNLCSSNFLELFINSIIDNSHLQNIHELDVGGKILKLQVMKKILLSFPNLKKCVIYSEHFLTREIEELVQGLPACINKVWLGESRFPGHSELYFSQLV